MFIPRNKRLLMVFSLCMFTGGILFSLRGYTDRQTVSTGQVCRSEYAITLHSTSDPLFSEGVFYLFSENSGQLILSVHAKLVTEKGTYNIARRIVYKITRTQRGNIHEIQSTFIRSEKYLDDDAPDREVDLRLFGTLQKDGSRFKVENLSPETLVIGTYFSPTYICQIES